MERLTIFAEEIAMITNENLRASLQRFILLVPDYFFTVPASSSGKYHPSYAHGHGGLVRHTKATVKIAQALMQNEALYNFSAFEKDLIIYALVIHDSFKLGEKKEKYTRFDHPNIAANKIIENQTYLLLSVETAKLLAELVASHMGPWVYNNKGEKVLPKPNSHMAKFVHLCDYLASQTFLMIDFS